MLLSQVRRTHDHDETGMRTRPEGLATTGMIALFLAASYLSGCTLDQILIGQSYILATPPAGACPSLTWRFVVNPQRAISGSLAYGTQSPVATLSGQLAADDSFRMAATGIAGHGTADVTGRFTSQVSTITIHGDAAGSACDGQTFELRLGSYFAHQGGGGGGGG
jgi:hypothetical protein